MPKGIPKSGKRINSLVNCKICNKQMTYNGLTASHIRFKHFLTKEEYELKYGKIKENNVVKSFNCLICKDKFQSEFSLSHHLRSSHNIQKKEYVLKYILNDIHPKCKCGCGSNVEILSKHPYHRNYISGHNPNGMVGKLHDISSKELMREKAILRKFKGINSYNTKPELDFESWLITNSISYMHPAITKYGCVDFYLPDYDLYVEIDGEYWHPLKIENLNLQQLQTVINDYSRDPISNLIRIRSCDIKNISKIDDLVLLNHTYDRTILYKQPIISKQYLNKIDQKQLISISNLILRLLRIRNEQFPINNTIHPATYYINKIQKYNLDTIFDGNVIRNNTSSIGIDFLKSIFKSYWNSSYKNSLSPMQVWNDDKLMKKIIDYRIGLNSINETFDLTLHQLIRGISARRYTISFFKPITAAAIYKKFINKSDPIVLDPCAGFGGRMLGFKSIYPNGTYIGIEPNVDTYSELVELSKNFTNIILYNCTIEEYINFKNNLPVDLTFTSIPYYDTETYSNVVSYKNYQEWCDSFLSSISSLPKLIINLPSRLKDDLVNRCNMPLQEEYIFRSNSDHFSKNNFRDELLLKFYQY